MVRNPSCYVQIAHVAWVNTTVFDYDEKLKTDNVKLYTWPIDWELEESVHYMGGTVQNPSTSECLSLEVEIVHPKLPNNAISTGKSIVYPSKDQVLNIAKEFGEVTIPAVS